MYAPLLNQIGALSLNVIWDFETTSIFFLYQRDSDQLKYKFQIPLRFLLLGKAVVENFVVGFTTQQIIDFVLNFVSVFTFQPVFPVI
mgnify:CR=1 FL=1